MQHKNKLILPLFIVLFPLILFLMTGSVSAEAATPDRHLLDSGYDANGYYYETYLLISDSEFPNTGGVSLFIDTIVTYPLNTTPPATYYYDGKINNQRYAGTLSLYKTEETATNLYAYYRGSVYPMASN